MKILHVSMRYDYGDRARGESYEYHNFFDGLKRAGHDVELFDFMEETARQGKKKMNAALLARAASFAPDVALVSLYTDQFVPETMDKLRDITKTLCFFHDDMWRREFARAWAPHFDAFTSSDFEAVNKYRRIGLDHIIHFPFGVNEALYKPTHAAKKYDVAFVGQWHPYREWLIRRIRKAGIDVKVAGYGWPGGPVGFDDMVSIFNESRINLNLSNSTSWDTRYLASSLRALRSRLRSTKTVEQLKARHFELNACDAFQLSYYVDGLERCYRIGEEIAVYLDPDDLVDKVKYYLADKDLTSKIAAAGYSRTLADHTYSKRFQGVFAQMDLAIHRRGAGA